MSERRVFNKRRGLTVERLRELYSYDGQVGRFVSLSGSGTRWKKGRVAGTARSDERRQIKIDGVIYLEHILVWLYVHGKWPDWEIDHIDGDPSNNRVENLRDVSSTVNKQNQRKPNADKKSCGFLGVSWFASRKKWRAEIRWGGRRHFIGNFDTAEEAGAAYLAEKRIRHEGCTI